MRVRALVFAMLISAQVFQLAGCSSLPAAPTPTRTREVATPTQTMAPSRTPTSHPSPTLPSTPQLFGEIMLRPLPGAGHGSRAIAVLDGRTYVANYGSDSVSVIEGNQVSKVIAVGKAPIDITADHTTGLVYVANEGDDSVSFLSGVALVRSVPGPDSPACLAALGGRLYVGGRGENALWVLDGLSGERLASVPLKASIGVLALAVNPSKNLLYASVYNAIEIVDLHDLTVVGRLEREVYLTLGADPSSERLYVGEYDPTDGTQNLVAYHALGLRALGRVKIGGDPRGMVVDAARERIYVANSWTNDVSIVDSVALEWIQNVPVGLRPFDIAVGDQGQVYVVNEGSANVAVLGAETHQLERAIPLAMLPGSMAVEPDTGQLYVASASTNSVLVVQDQQVISEFETGLHPWDVALGADGRTLAVLNHVGGDLVLFSTESGQVLARAMVGQLPRGLAFAPDQGELLVSDAVRDANGQRILRDIELRTIYGTTVSPIQVHIDPESERAFLIASNGVPGSNGGYIVYAVDLRSGRVLEGQVGGLSMTGLTLDPAGGRVFSTAGRFGSFQLILNDLRTLDQVTALALPGYPAALDYNPATLHIFVYLSPSSNTSLDSGGEVRVLDSRGLGTVARIHLSEHERANLAMDAHRMAVDTRRGWVYLADAWRGVVHVLQDTVLPPPPSPTPTYTPTPWPTSGATHSPVPTFTSAPEPSCAVMPEPPFDLAWSMDADLRRAIGCPVTEIQSGPMAEQPFERGAMLWRGADPAVFVLYEDGVWRAVPDFWKEGMPESSCEASPPSGLTQPKRGFGLVWCVEAGVSAGLGWGTEEERGYTGWWQLFERGEMIAASSGDMGYALLGDETYRPATLR